MSGEVVCKMIKPYNPFEIHSTELVTEIIRRDYGHKLKGS